MFCLFMAVDQQHSSVFVVHGLYARSHADAGGKPGHQTGRHDPRRDGPQRLHPIRVGELVDYSKKAGYAPTCVSMEER